MEAHFLQAAPVVKTERDSHTRAIANGEPELRATGVPRIHLAEIKIETRRGPQFVDLTERVTEMLRKTGIREGNALIYSRHTTAGIVVNENEPLLIKDMQRFLCDLASPGDHYDHNDFEIRTVNMCDDECANGHAHCQHLTIGCSATLPIVDGELALGRWQRIFLLELDRPRPRNVMIQIFGI